MSTPRSGRPAWAWRAVSAVVIPNGVEAAAAFLCIAATCTYVPLNPDETVEALESCFAQLSPAAVIVREGHATAARAAAHSLGLPLIILFPSLSDDAGRFRLHAPSLGEVAPDLEPEPDNLALFMQTSGTVGGPKLVMHSHQTILSAAISLVECFHLSAGDRAISIAPMFHSLALVGTVLTAAISGSSLICASDSSPQMFFEGMDEFSPTWFGAVPSMLQAILLDAPQFEHVIRRRQLRFFRSVAAPLPACAQPQENPFPADSQKATAHRTYDSNPTFSAGVCARRN